MRSWLPERSLGPQPSWRLWYAEASLEALERLFHEQQLPVYVGILVLSPVSEENASYDHWTEPIRACFTELESIQFVTQKCQLSPFELVQCLLRARQAGSAPAVAPSQEVHTQSRTGSSASAAAHVAPGGPACTALTRDPQQLMAVDAKRRFILPLEEALYRRLGLIGRGHQPRLARRRYRRPVYGDGAFVIIDLALLQEKPESKYRQQVTRGLQRFTDRLEWQLASISGTDAPLSPELGAVEDTACRVYTGTATSTFPWLYRNVLPQAYTTAEEFHDPLERAENFSMLMDALGFLMRAPRGKCIEDASQETRSYLQPMWSARADADTQAEQLSFYRFEWGATQASLLPHAWWKRILPLVWKLHSTPTDSSLQIVLQVRYQGLADEATSRKHRYNTLQHSPYTRNLVGFFGSTSELPFSSTRVNGAHDQLPFVSFEQPL
jgi:hypothetical protein